MELTTIAGFAAAPLLMVILGWAFNILARIIYGQWNQDMLPNGVKVTIAPLVGVGLGFLTMLTDTYLLNPPLAINIVSWIKYGFAGFLLGAAAIGLNQIQKGGK